MLLLAPLSLFAAEEEIIFRGQKIYVDGVTEKKAFAAANNAAGGKIVFTVEATSPFLNDGKTKKMKLIAIAIRQLMISYAHLKRLILSLNPLDISITISSYDSGEI